MAIGLDRAGWPFILGAVVVALAGAWLAGRLWAIPGLLLAVGFVFFFRDPERPLPADQELVVSPADGEVKCRSGRRCPAAPTARGSRSPSSCRRSTCTSIGPRSRDGSRASLYKPGRFLPAYRPESGAVNEQAEIWVDHNARTAVYRQVVGILARRVVNRVREGEELRVGQRVGVMKFGSRMDVFLPVDLPVLVTPRDRVVAGVTVLARWNGR